MLQNGNFSGGWETLPAIEEAGFLKNQKPMGWEISWLNKNEAMYGDPNSVATGIPECVHKLSEQLPANEQLDGPDALILDGDATYKIFSFAAAFGATLKQTVTGLKPGSSATLTVPIQVHLRGETDPYGAESGVWVNGEGRWVNGFDMGDHKWYRHEVKFTVPDSGQAEIVIRVKSKWPRGKDFFIDGVTLDARPDGGGGSQPPGETGTPGSGDGTTQTVFIQVPPGVQVNTSSGSATGVIEVKVPSGVTVEVV